MSTLTNTTLYRIAWGAVALMMIGALAGIVVPAGIGWDFANFYDAGRKVLAGQVGDLYNPDAFIAGAAPQGVLQFWSTPITAWLYAPLALLPPLAAMTVFKFQNVIAYAIALALLFLEYRRVAGRSDREQAVFAALFTCLALVYQPFWTVFRVGGQTMPTVFLLLVLALLAHMRRRNGTTAALLVAAVAIKPAFAPVLVILALLSGPALIGWSAAWGAIAGLASVALLGWPIHATFLDQLRTATAELGAPWYYNSSPMVLLGNRALLAEPGADLFYSALGWGIRLAVVAFATFMVLRARAARLDGEARRHFDFSIAILVCLLLATVAWEHYLSALFPLLALLVARIDALGRGARVLIATIFALSIPQNLILVNLVRYNFVFDGHIALFVIGLIKSAPLWLTAVLLARHRDDILRAYAGSDWTRGPVDDAEHAVAAAVRAPAGSAGVP